MTDIATILGTVLTVYAMGVFLISENRAPPATFHRTLLKQDLEAAALHVLSPILSAQDSLIARLEGDNVNRRPLMKLVRRTSCSVLTKDNRVEVLQDASRSILA